MFGLDDSKTPAAPRRYSSIARSTDTVCVTEVGGSSDPAEVGPPVGNEKADAAWLDQYWSAFCYPINASPRGGIGMTNPRFQSQQGKHLQKVAVVYLDGHSAVAKPSRLVCGQFYATYSGNVLLGYGSSQVPWDSPVSNAALDASEFPPEHCPCHRLWTCYRYTPSRASAPALLGVKLVETADLMPLDCPNLSARWDSQGLASLTAEAA